MEHILTGPYNKPTNNSRRPPRGAYLPSAASGIMIKAAQLARASTARAAFIHLAIH
ncbi:MAG: hypothetical protein ACMX3H_14755 [Sodalis sp. (in: enterobacteria)]|uniref:hypothetical protein n=1 Tax=Sodalis sp. (in: enterobacteria) TaxID=1898979 RepID=UPI0039E643D2